MPIRLPESTFDIFSATTAVPNSAQRVLFIGQKTPAGTATPLTLVTSLQNEGKEDELFGPRSMLAGMIRAARKINLDTRFDAIALDDDGSAVKATGAFAVSGTATGDGTIYITVGSSINHRYQIDVIETDDNIMIAEAIEKAINDDPDVPVTPVETTGTVDLTAANGGEEGNFIGLRVEGSIPGVTITITAMSGGATNPSLTTVFDPIVGRRYQGIVWPGSYPIEPLREELDQRFNVNNNILDGIGFTFHTGTLGSLTTEGDTLNSQNLIIGGNQSFDLDDYKGSGIFELNTVIASVFGSLRGKRLTEGADLAGITISTAGGLDRIGGPALASYPYFNTPFPTLPIVDTDKQWSQTEINALNDAGITVFSSNITNTTLLAGNVVTTYKTNVLGNPDPSFKFLNYVDTMTTIREYIANNVRAQYAQARLTTGDIVQLRSMTNVDDIRSYIIQLYGELSGPDFVLAVAGDQALNFFKQNLTVIRESSQVGAGKVQVNMQVPIVEQLREIDGAIQVSFSVDTN